jgi:hypothetical protein
MMRALGRLRHWRPVLAPPPSSLPIDTFLGWLGATPYAWDITPEGKLRARDGDGGAQLCAVTAVARYRMGHMYGVGDWIRAGVSIGLSYADAGLIVTAADDASARGVAKRLRVRLLSAALAPHPGEPCDGTPAATPPASHGSRRAEPGPDRDLAPCQAWSADASRARGAPPPGRRRRTPIDAAAA